MRIEITESYSIDLPEGLKEDVDPRVSSFWFEDDGLFLQLSSYKLESGEQIAANERLEEHLLKKGIEIRAEVKLSVKSPDFAGVVFSDDKGWQWLFSYLVWPDLTIFATIVSSNNDSPILGSWATEAIESIERSG